MIDGEPGGISDTGWRRAMAEEFDGDETLMSRIYAGDPQALAQLFGKHRERLRRMVRLRLDRRLRGRIDPSDVLQEAFIDAHNRQHECRADPRMPPFLWLRFLTGQRLLALHRRHLGAQMREAGREVSLQAGAMPQADSPALANFLLGRLTTPSLAAIRVEMRVRLQDVLNTMDPIDREVLVLRHFEELSNGETAAILGLQKAAASNRYVRALRRLTDILATMPGFLE
jgi:RNA polymerase sigma-70 factor, ECF subfamily